MGYILESFYLVVVGACLIYYFLLLQDNKSDWQLVALEENKKPLVSIIVPTLEEENNIGICLQSLDNLNYPNKEIIVIDGGSKDKTIEVIQKYPVKLIIEPELPDGWIGKSYACHLGYKESKGEILLFTDADTYHSPKSLDITLAHLLGTGADLFTLQPFQKAERWYEYILAFFYFLSLLAGGSKSTINNPYNKESFLASGQYMLFTRIGYKGIGGHVAVRSSLIEDLALAKLCKDKNFKLNFMDSTDIVLTRMYPESFSSFFKGFRKVIWEGIQTIAPWRVFFIILWLIYFVLSPYFLVYYFIDHSNWLWWDYTIGIIVNIILYAIYAIAIHLYWRNRGDWKFYIYLTYPITMLIGLIIILVAIIYGITGRKVSWKNRYYSFDKNSVNR